MNSLDHHFDILIFCERLSANGSAAPVDFVSIFTLFTSVSCAGMISRELEIVVGPRC